MVTWIADAGFFNSFSRSPWHVSGRGHVSRSHAPVFCLAHSRVQHVFFRSKASHSFTRGHWCSYVTTRPPAQRHNRYLAIRRHIAAPLHSLKRHVEYVQVVQGLVFKATLAVLFHKVVMDMLLPLGCCDPRANILCARAKISRFRHHSRLHYMFRTINSKRRSIRAHFLDPTTFC